MIIFLLVLATVALGVYFGYLAGVRVERGRTVRLTELRGEADPPERRGVRLRTIRVSR
jgi:hypothetical protein